ncbi:MAG: hypothetical protein R3E10_13185 [Gemmatimonadota bacterium]
MKRLPIFAVPVLLALGVLLIPVVDDYADHGLAAAASLESTRWFVGHLLSAMAFGSAILAGGIIALRLQRSEPLSWLGLAFLAPGAVLHVVGLGADGIAPLAVRTGGGLPDAYFDGGFWVTGVFISGAALFGVGVLLLVLGLMRADLLKGGARYLTFAAALAFPAAEAVPYGWALFLVACLAFCVWIPIGLAMREGV